MRIKKFTILKLIVSFILLVAVIKLHTDNYDENLIQKFKYIQGIGFRNFRSVRLENDEQTEPVIF
jgi:hypothetical protein